MVTSDNVKFIGLGVLLLLFACSSYGFTDTKQAPLVRVGLIIFPPFVQQHTDGKCTGSSVDEVYKVFRPHGYQILLSCASPARIYRDIELNRIDLTINIKTTQSLKNLVEYSMLPHRQLEVVLYTNSLLTGNKVSSINKFEYHGMRDKLQGKDYRFVDHTNIKESLTVFFRGATTHLISYRHPFNYYLSQETAQRAFKQLSVDYAETSLTFAPTYYAINKQSHIASLIKTHINEFQQPLD